MNGTSPTSLRSAPHTAVYAYVTSTNVCPAFTTALLFWSKPAPAPPFPHFQRCGLGFVYLDHRQFEHDRILKVFQRALHPPTLCLQTVPVIPFKVHVTSFVPAGRFLVWIRQDVRFDTWPVHEALLLGSNKSTINTYLQINFCNSPTCLSSEIIKLRSPLLKTTVNLSHVRLQKTAMLQWNHLPCGWQQDQPDVGFALFDALTDTVFLSPSKHCGKYNKEASFSWKAKPSVVLEAPKSGLNAMFSEACWIINHAMLLHWSLGTKTKIQK